MQKEELKLYYNSTPCLLFCQWLFRAHFSLIAGIFVTLFWPSLPIFAQIKSWGKSIAMRSFEFVIICCTGIIRITLYTIWSPPLPLTQIIQCHFLGGFFFGGGGGGGGGTYLTSRTRMQKNWIFLQQCFWLWSIIYERKKAFMCFWNVILLLV